MEKKVYEFIADQAGEKIVERKKCPECGEEFAITDKDMEFYGKVSPTFNGQKYSIPAPTLCPDCRNRRRLARRNERKLYKRKCDLTGKSIISIFSPDSPYKVYDQKERWSDKWDPMDYGRDFDFTRPFFEQFDKLLRDIPKQNLFNISSENSEYCSLVNNVKNCYLISGNDSEDCLYGIYTTLSKDCIDYFFSVSNQNCYQFIELYNCYNVFFSQNVKNSRNCYFMYNCEGCSECFGCVNLVDKKYCYFNEQKTKEEYREIIDNIRWDVKIIEKISKDFNEFRKIYPRASANKNLAQKSFGNNIRSIKNTKFCFDSDGTEGTIEDSAFITLSTNTSNCYDVDDTGGGSQFCIEGSTIHISRIYFSHNILDCNNIYYSDSCFNSSNLFGCVGLRNKQYCILNKQHTKEEYEQLVPKIIEHMKNTSERGEFFPANISCFGYNETVANDYFPLDRESALSKGFKRQDKEYPINVPEGTETINAKDLSENINDVTDEILKKAIICEVSGKPFRIVKPELEFYRKHNLPLPRKHPDIRHLERLSKRAPRKLYLRTCDNCGKQVISVYPQNSDFKVYCDECYNKEIY